MFRIKSNDDEIYNLKSKDYLVETPKLTMELNKSGELSFYIPPTHPNYEKIKGLTSKIKLYNNNVLEFVGRAIENKDSFNKKRYVKIEGELSYLYDSIQRLNVYKCTPIQFFQKIIENHNNQVEEDKRFNVGMFTIQDANDYIYRYTNYEDTLTVINEKLIKQLGGFLRVRYANGNRYLDLLQDYGRTNSQVIKFGENILDLDKYIKFSSIRTAMIPLGNELDETVETEDETGTIKKRLTIEEFPDGKYGDIVKRGDMIYSESGVAKYGYIYADKEDSLFNNITLKENLFSKSVESLNKLLENSLTIELTAIDLNLINVDIEKIELGDKIRVLSSAHNLDEFFVVNKIVKDLANPKNNKIILGNSLKSMTSSINRAENNNTNMINELSGKTSNDLIDAKQKASDAIKSVQGGYVKLIDGELFILDNENINLARKIWRWNLNGLGYTQEGKDGTYGLAMTMDGQIVADYITTGTLRSLQIINGDNFSVDKSGHIIAKSGEIAGFSMWTDVANGDNRSWLTKDFIDNGQKYRSGILVRNSYNTDFIFAGMPIGSDGSWSTENAATRIFNNGRIITKDIQINVDGSFYYKYNNGKTAKQISGLATWEYLSNGNYWAYEGVGNQNGTPVCILKGMNDALWYEIQDLLHGRTIIRFHRIDNSGNPAHIEAYCDFNTTGAINCSGIKANGQPPIMTTTEDSHYIKYMMHNVSYVHYEVNGYGAFGINVFQSDKRLKKNIEVGKNVNALNVINRIKHYKYNWKRDDKKVKLGYITQQLKKVDPDLILKVKQPKDSKYKELQQVDETRLIPYITKAIQELYKQNQELKKEIIPLKGGNYGRK